MTCEFLFKICAAFGITLNGVELRKDGPHFRADVAFARGRTSVSFTTDAGDAAALAFYFDAPVYKDVLEKAGPWKNRP